jgi:hypothetical protein
MRPAFWCLAATLMIPVLFLAVVGGLEYAGQKDLALLLGWLMIPFAMLAVPAGLLLTLVVAITSRKQK